MKGRALFTFGTILLLSVACVDSLSPDGNAVPRQSKQTLRRVQSSLDETTPSSIPVREIKLSMANPLKVQFGTATHGWLASGRGLFKTEDGGVSWKDLGLTVPPDAEVGDVLFLNDSVGWLVMKNETGYILDYPKNSAWLMQTTDGGQTWALNYQEKGVAAVHSAFSQEGDGWLTGIKSVASDEIRYTYLVLRTTDQGQHWSDVSPNLKRLDKEDPSGRPNDGILGVVAEGPLKAVVITSRMRVIRTIDGGKVWEEIASLRDELDRQAGVRRFGRSADGLWVVASADSVEGTRGVLMVQQAGNTWVRSELDGAYFADAVSLSQSEFVACGYVKKEVKQSGKYKTIKEGVVLYSSDGGAHWRVIYRNSAVEVFSSLSVVSRDNVWAAGAGTLVHLSFP